MEIQKIFTLYLQKADQTLSLGFNYFCLILDLSSPQSKPQSTSLIIFNGFVEKINIQFKNLRAGRRLWDLLCGKLAFIHPESYPRIAMVTFCNKNRRELCQQNQQQICFLPFVFHLSDGKFRGSQSSIWHFIRVHKLCSQSDLLDYKSLGVTSASCIINEMAYLQRWHSYINCEKLWLKG